MIRPINSGINQSFVGDFQIVFSHIIFVKCIDVARWPEIAQRHLSEFGTLFVMDQIFVSETAILLFA